MESGEKGPQIRKSDIRLDWKEYFRLFLEEHGEPILYNGKLLFQDGWQYSSTQYQGPENPPPEDTKELHYLQVVYWTYLAKKFIEEIRVISNQIRSLKDWSKVRSLPLQSRVSYRDMSLEGTLIRKLSPPENLNLRSLETSLDDLRIFYSEAETRLKELSLRK